MVTGLITMCILADTSCEVKQNVFIIPRIKREESIQFVCKSFLSAKKFDKSFYILWNKPEILPRISFGVICSPRLFRFYRMKDGVPTTIGHSPTKESYFLIIIKFIIAGSFAEIFIIFDLIHRFCHQSNTRSTYGIFKRGGNRTVLHHIRGYCFEIPVKIHSTYIAHSNGF